MALLTALSLQNANDVDVSFMIDGQRNVTKAAGFSAIAAREVVIPRAGHRGSRNLTRYRDDMPMIIEGILLGRNGDDAWAQWDSIAGAFADAVDTDRLLKWTAGTALPLQRMVRLSSVDGPLEVGPDMIAYQATLRASDPNIYSQIQQTSFASPLGSTSGGGLVMPFTFPFVFNAPASTAASFTNGGSVPTPPTFALWGYLLNPTIRLEPNGPLLVFNGEIASGDLLVVDEDARTVVLNGTQDQLSLLNITSSTWFELPRGSGTITLLASSFTSGAGMSVTWRDART